MYFFFIYFFYFLFLNRYYLHHTVTPAVLHRDLKTDNILVTRDGKFKLGDFGISRQLTGNNMQKTRLIGSLIYMAPEVLTGDYTEKCDVFSYGILLGELWGRHPFFGPNNNRTESSNHLSLISSLEKRSLKVEFPENCPKHIKDLIAVCLSWDPNLRPSFVEITKMLK
jgi:serine/threonine protein kinase